MRMGALRVVYVGMVFISTFGWAEESFDSDFISSSDVYTYLERRDLKTSFQQPYQLYQSEILPLVKTLTKNAHFDGTEMGNGGFVIQCDQPEPDATFFYDYFLYMNTNRSHYGGILFDALPQESVDDIVTKWLNAYSQIDRLFAHRLMEFYQSFWNKVTWINNEGDSSSSERPFLRAFQPFGHLLIWRPKYKSCRVRQMISYVTMDGDYYYVIVKEDYEKLDNRNRAAAVVHELFYHELNSSGLPTTGSPTRLLEDMIDLRTYDSAYYPEWRKSLSIRNLYAKKKVGFSFAQYEEYIIQLNHFSDLEPLVPKEKEIEFMVGWYDPYDFRTSYGQHYYLKEAYLYPTEIYLRSENSTVTLKVGGRSTFWPTGKLRQSSLLSGTVGLSISGQSKECTQTLLFDPLGNISDCE